MLINILLPIHNLEYIFLLNNLKSIFMQTYQDYLIIITDQNESNEMEQFINNNILIQKYIHKIKYIKSDKKGWSNNHNNGLLHCNGDLIRIMHYDNYFIIPNALENIINIFKDDNVNWCVSTYIHCKEGNFTNIHIPKYTDNIIVGHNYIGDPSCLTIRNKNLQYFDDNLTFMVDCDYYKRLHDLYGNPYVINNTDFVCSQHPLQLTHFCSEINNMKERVYMEFKYKKLNIIGDDNPYRDELKELYLLQVIKQFQKLF